MTHAPCPPAARGAGNPLFDLSVSLNQRVAQLRQRRELKRLLDHPDYALSDMGIDRGDLDWVLSLPLSQDAQAELRRLSQNRHKNRLKPQGGITRPML